MASKVHNYSRAFKSLRVLLIQELPDPTDLLGSSPAFSDKLPPFSRDKILSPSSHCERAEKLVDVMELCSSPEVFQAFLAALRPLNPDLAAKVEQTQREEEEKGGKAAKGPACSPKRVMEDASPTSAVNANERLRISRQQQPVQIENAGGEGSMQQEPLARRGEEDAGIYGLNGLTLGHPGHIKCLSYTCLQFLGSKLNGNPPKRNTFHSFCHALGVENKLVQASSRSGNPTAYLLQKYSSRPEATLEKLRCALAEIGMVNVFEQLTVMLGNEVGGGGQDPEDY